MARCNSWCIPRCRDGCSKVHNSWCSVGLVWVYYGCSMGVVIGVVWM